MSLCVCRILKLTQPLKASVKSGVQIMIGLSITTEQQPSHFSADASPPPVYTSHHEKLLKLLWTLG